MKFLNDSWRSEILAKGGEGTHTPLAFKKLVPMVVELPDLFAYFLSASGLKIQTFGDF